MEPSSQARLKVQRACLPQDPKVSTISGAHSKHLGLLVNFLCSVSDSAAAQQAITLASMIIFDSSIEVTN